MRQLAELFGAGHEVCFTVERYQHGLFLIVAYVNKHRTFFSIAVRPGSRYFLSFLSEYLNGFVEISFGLSKGFFTIHHTGASHLAKFVYILC